MAVGVSMSININDNNSINSNYDNSIVPVVYHDCV